MSTRHLVMLSLGGAIGTGLFLGSGEVISQTGAIGAIIAYILGGAIAYMVMLCLGELAVHMPVSGSFGAYAKKYISPSTGYMISWMYWLTWTATLGTEFTAAALLMQEWFPQISMWIWTIIFAVTIFGLNISSTRIFAESEFWLALVKVVTVIAFIVQALTDSEDWGMAAPEAPDALGGLPDLSIVGDVNLVGAFANIGVISTVLLIFTLLLTNFFDAMGTMTGLGKQAKLVDENGNLPGMKKALVVEGAGAVAGGLGSASSNTVFADSSAGIADGARTGLANIMTGLLFIAAMFFTPLYEIVPIEAAAPVLVIVGVMMAAQLTDIPWTRMEVAIPAFLTIVVMPFTYSIANGIGVGFITFALMSTFAGKAKQVHWIMWLLAGLFVIYFGIDPISEAIS